MDLALWTLAFFAVVAVVKYKLVLGYFNPRLAYKFNSQADTRVTRQAQRLIAGGHLTNYESVKVYVEDKLPQLLTSRHQTVRPIEPVWEDMITRNLPAGTAPTRAQLGAAAHSERVHQIMGNATAGTTLYVAHYNPR